MRIFVATLCAASLLGATWDAALSGAGMRQDKGASSSWLDQPVASWNVPTRGVPKPPRTDEPRTDVIKRCELPLRNSTPGERALADAGWIPFLNVDQQLVRDDVEIVGGMSAADGMCRPSGYNVFVFIGGAFAGTLSPAVMTSHLDSSSGAVRIVAKDTITADFARYASSDPLCCLSSHVVVRYKVDRSGSSPIVVPTERRVRP